MDKNLSCCMSAKLRLPGEEEEDEVDEADVEHLLSVFRTWSRSHPDSFRRIAPDLIRQGMFRSNRGKDPRAYERLEKWIAMNNRVEMNDRLFSSFFLIEELDSESSGFSVNRFRGAKRDWLLALAERFDDAPARWDAATRDQFIVLGMLARHATGVNQATLGAQLGVNLDDEDAVKRIANMLRAAKIALTRLGRGAGLEQVFRKAHGAGLARIHAFADPGMAQATARFIEEHPASALYIPQTSPFDVAAAAAA